ncbi:TPA: LOW QUALITY PROTEIN: hypothetical protein N0F65_004382 [Lagenidium giganteum]|uniref:Uncharacterized protein n=1 Tax=Lagenidium giganteum TaxID=4803 RepID=A0AAV2ZNN5_9STRA|nr:TPA: LOW QUALITY PROTEIN: hypothetical protein N0F65_004382 [Lagenidium giganteum]
MSARSSPHLVAMDDSVAIRGRSHREVCREATLVVLDVLSHSILFGLVAVLANFVFAHSDDLAGTTPRSFPRFATALSFWCSTIIGVSLVLAQAASFRTLHFNSNPNETPSLPECAKRLIRLSWSKIVMCSALTTFATLTVVSLNPSAIINAKALLYIDFATATLLVVCIEVDKKRLFQTQTVEGLVTVKHTSKPYWHRVASALVRNPAVYLLCLAAHGVMYEDGQNVGGSVGYYPKTAIGAAELDAPVVLSRQVVTELVVDFLCCVVEISFGLPLRISQGLSAFVVGMFVYLSVVSIVLCALAYIAHM